MDPPITMAFIDKISKEEVYNAVKQHGPIIPYGIRKQTGKGDSTTIGAALSELSKNDKVDSTNVKKGSSPFYYVPEKKEKLETLIEFLEKKERDVVQKLQQQKVLRDENLESLERVSLRNTPDFSKKLIVNINGDKKTFWRYFLVPEDKAVEIIKDRLRQDNQQSQDDNQESPKPTEDTAKEEQDTAPDEDQSSADTTTHDTEQERLEPDYDYDDPFYEKIIDYLNQNDVEVLHVDQIRKNRDYALDINVPTSLGTLEFYCRCRNIKKINKGDVTRAYIQGIKKQKPTLILTTGEVGSKTKEQIDNEFKGLIIKEEL